ncbi:hypothetical protein F3J11_29780 [Burkholderia sp. Cy-647]|nr:hypothetical protein [Burkholderia sp. Tr-860]NIF66820.1 hypothetical protein [Burkholderia sp. Cy-647]NIF95945.1 hypothetical protein [Burkholderia sp. Ax-1720]
MVDGRVETGLMEQEGHECGRGESAVRPRVEAGSPATIRTVIACGNPRSNPDSRNGALNAILYNTAVFPKPAGLLQALSAVD